MRSDLTARLAALPGADDLAALAARVDRADPAGVRGAGAAFTRAAEGMSGCRQDVHRAVSGVGDTWRGAGARAFADWADEFGRAGGRTEQAVRGVGTEVDGIATTLQGLRDELRGHISRALDAADAARTVAATRLPTDGTAVVGPDEVVRGAVAGPTADAQAAVARAEAELASAAGRLRALMAGFHGYSRLAVPDSSGDASGGSAGSVVQEAAQTTPTDGHDATSPGDGAALSDTDAPDTGTATTTPDTGSVANAPDMATDAETSTGTDTDTDTGETGTPAAGTTEAGSPDAAPSGSEPTTPESTTPDPAAPDPAAPESDTPDPATPDPAPSDATPATSDPVTPDTAPSDSATATPAPTTPAPAAPDPAPAATPLTGGPPGKVGDWIREATGILAASGVPADKMDPDDIATIIARESGGNPDAVNNWDSNAAKGTPSQGLMQTIEPTFDAHKLPGHGDIRDPIDNIIAGVRYSIDRYGSVSSVPGIKALGRGGGYVGY